MVRGSAEFGKKIYISIKLSAEAVLKRIPTHYVGALVSTARPGSFLIPKIGIH